MDISKLHSITLRDCIGLWLAEQGEIAVRMRDRAIDFFRHDPSPENLKRMKYYVHAVKAMKWLTAQLPTRFDDVVLYNQMDDVEVAEFIEAIVQGKKSWRF